MQSKASGFGKRANVQEIAFIVVVVVVIGITILFGYKLMSKMNEKVQNLQVMDDDAKKASQAVLESSASPLDILFVMFLFITFIIAVISAYYIDIHPIFFVLSLIVCIGILIGTYIATELNKELITDEAFADIIPNFPMMSWISLHLFGISVVMVGVILIALYAKLRGGDYG